MRETTIELAGAIGVIIYSSGIARRAPPQGSSVDRLRGVLAGTQIVPHVENEIYIIQESNPLNPLVGRDLRRSVYGPNL